MGGCSATYCLKATAMQQVEGFEVFQQLDRPDGACLC